MTGPPKGEEEAFIFDIITKSIVSVEGTTPEENEGFDDYTIALNIIFGLKSIVGNILDDQESFKLYNKMCSITNDKAVAYHLEKNNNEVLNYILEDIEYIKTDTLVDIIAYIANNGMNEGSVIMLAYIQNLSEREERIRENIHWISRLAKSCITKRDRAPLVLVGKTIVMGAMFA